MKTRAANSAHGGNASANTCDGVLLVLCCLLAFDASAAGVSQGALDEIGALLNEKASWTPVQAKLDSELIHAVKGRRQQAFAAGARKLRLDLQPQADGRVLVDISAEVTPGLLALIKRGGGQVINSFPRFHAIRALATLDQLEALAETGDVVFIKRAVPALTNTGSVNSQGDVTHLASAARNGFGATGSGIKVGVLSDSVDYLASSQALGDLGTVTVLPGQDGTGSGEGTAMLEIVHDLAPDAQLYFATAFNGEASFAQNILDLFNHGCSIIIDDVGYFDESPFQDAVIAQAVNTVTAGGALYFSAAGNSGNLDAHTSGTWEGDFVDGGAAGGPIPESGRIHSFGPLTYNTVTNAGYALTLFWSDPLGGSTNDYDLFLLDSTSSSVVASSMNRQTGSQDPYEYISYPGSGQRVVIVKYSGAGRFLHLDTQRGRLSLPTSGATAGHSAATNAFSVAAVPAAGLAPAGYPSGPFPNSFASTNQLEPFSSDGPRHVFFFANGAAITPGNLSSTGGAIRQKPDIAAADGVSTSLPAQTGLNPFFGTSAAAPHAGAIAALIWSYNAALTSAQLRGLLKGTALDIGPAGIDRDSGSGVVMAYPALTNLTGTTPLGINCQPENQRIPVGSTAAFVVTVVGTPPFSYSWRRNGSAIAGATASSYSTNNVQLADSGSQFSCQVSGVQGSRLSSSGTLTVFTAPANDQCVGATLIPTVPYPYQIVESTTNASSVGDPVSYCFPGPANGVWFKFTPSCDGSIEMFTWQSSMDTVLGIYTGTCNSLTQVGCAITEFPGSGASFSTSVVGGTAYYILAGGYLGATGNLGLYFSYNSAPHLVTNTNDSGAGSLRQAILDANACGGDIGFSGVTGTITLQSPLPGLAASTTITGPGSNLLSLSGNGRFRVLSVGNQSSVSISALTIANGSVTNADGGGIVNDGGLGLYDCRLVNCQARDGNGGAILSSGSLWLDNCTLSNCTASSTLCSQAGAGGAIYTSGNLTMTNCRLISCFGFHGGGIYNAGNLSLAGSLLAGCQNNCAQGDGGGIYNYTSGTATLDTCTVTSCIASYWGGGLVNHGTLSVTNTALEGNQASQQGGGAFVSGTSVFYGCTIAGNTSFLPGGGVSILAGNQSFYDCTISLNSASSGAAGIAGSGTNFLSHCTVVSNTGPHGITAGLSFNCNNCILSDCSGTLTSGGYNLIRDTTGCTISGDTTGNRYGLNPLLGPLRDNGGPTRTHALLPGSPAIDAGTSGGLPADQRGLPWPFDVPAYPNQADGSDIGAFEFTDDPSALIVVNNHDSGPGSLRQAILAANSQMGGEITFSNVTSPIVLASALPPLWANTTVTGPGTNQLTVSGTNQFRVLSINNGATVTLSGLTIADGGAVGYASYATGISNAGSLKLMNCVVRNCSGDPNYGIGIYNAGSLEMDGCIVADCRFLSPFSPASGGAIYNTGSLQVNGCVLSHCAVVDHPGGALFNQGNLVMRGSLIESCASYHEGEAGGLANVGTAVLSSCVITNCAAWDAAGISSANALFMTNSLVISNFAGGGSGGGLAVSSTAILSGCTIFGNTCQASGGGISNDGDLRLINCTLSQNASLHGGGGALDTFFGRPSTNSLNHCTVVSNSPPEILAGIAFSSQNSILGDCTGTLLSGGYNLILNITGCVITGNLTGNLFGVDPLLGPLQNNRGPTWTHALLPGSPAIDQGSSGGLPTDQRGSVRPFDYPAVSNAADGSDIGAFEATNPPAVIIPPGLTAIAWGANTDQQTNGPRTASFIAISAGAYHNLALRTNGTVVAWGQNTSGETNVPAALTNVTGIAAGWGFSLALRQNATVTNWGWTAGGLLDAAKSLSNVLAISAGWDHGMALRGNGTVTAFGLNTHSQTNVPAGLADATAVSAGGWHSLALRQNGTVVAWGDNHSGQTNLPTGLTNVAAIAGGGYHSLALKWDGTVLAWGTNSSGQLNVPAGLSNVVAVAAGTAHSLALHSDGTVVTWGDNSSGQRNVPAGLSNVVAISGGAAHSLVLAGDGSPFITVQPAGQRARVGDTVHFGVMAAGSPSLGYQWLKDGALLANGGRISGASSRTLTVASLADSDSGAYSVVVTNGRGAAVSVPASLTIGSLRFVDVRRLGGGAIQLTLAGAGGDVCAVLTSTNLLAWQTVGTVTNVSGTVQFVDNGATNQSRRFYRAVMQSAPAPIFITAPSGVVTAPLVVSNNFIYQPVQTTVVATGGRAAYNFNLASAGNYVIRATVNASDGAANSFFLNIDAEPQTPTMIWDIFPLTAGFEQRTVSWRGNGTDTANQFVPKVFNLTAGAHQLIIRGREAFVYLRDMTIMPYP